MIQDLIYVVNLNLRSSSWGEVMIEQLIRVIDMVKGFNINLAAVIVVGIGFTVLLIALSNK